MKASLCSIMFALLLGGCAKQEVNPKYAKAPPPMSPLAIANVASCLDDPSAMAGRSPVSQSSDPGPGIVAELRSYVAELGTVQPKSVAADCALLSRAVAGSAFVVPGDLSDAVRSFASKDPTSPRAVLVPVVWSSGSKCTQDTVRVGSTDVKTGTVSCRIEDVNAGLLLFSAEGELTWKSGRHLSMLGMDVKGPVDDFVALRGPQAVRTTAAPASEAKADAGMFFPDPGVRVTMPAGWVERNAHEGAAAKALFRGKGTGADDDLVALVIASPVARGTTAEEALVAQHEAMIARNAEWTLLSPATVITKNGLTGAESTNRHVLHARDGSTVTLKQTLRLFVRGDTQLLVSVTWSAARGERPESATHMLDAVDFPGPRAR